LSAGYTGIYGDSIKSRLEAGSWGDDYQLLFACNQNVPLPVSASRIGQFGEGKGVSLTMNGAPVPLPPTLGFEHK
jgi:thiamine-monophosphate kinase